MAVNKVVLRSGKVLMDTSGVTVAPGYLRKGKTALNAEGKLIEGTMEVGEISEVEQAVPVINVSESGLITASSQQESGFVAGGKTTAARQLDTQGAKEVMPTEADQVVVERGRYTTGAVTVKGDANFKEENIAEGVSLFGKIGTHKGGTGGESAAVGNVLLTVETTAEGNTIAEIYYSAFENGSVVTVHETPDANSISYDVLSGAFLVIRLTTNAIGAVSGEGAEVLSGVAAGSDIVWFYAKVTAEPGTTAIISL